MLSWINKTTGTHVDTTGESFVTSVTIEGRMHTIVHSPHAHALAVKRWGKETFFDGKLPAGIELHETAFGKYDHNHPDKRIYQPDFMMSINQPDKKVTHASHALIQDTGWWDVDFSMGEENTWGDDSAVDDEPFKGFPDGAQIPNWLPHLQYRETGYHCDPLYQGYYIRMKKVDCINPTTYSRYCKEKKFLDPLGYGVADEEQGDFVDYMKPNKK